MLTCSKGCFGVPVARTDRSVHLDHDEFRPGKVGLLLLQNASTSMVKLADINETAAFAWSHDTLPRIVTGTLSGVMDDTFSSDSQLSIYEPFANNKHPEKKDLKPVKSFAASGKFSSIEWNTNNVIACGLENSIIELYDSNKLLDANVSELIDAKITEYKKHTTSVLQVKYNPLQSSILASSGSKGEIFIWDTVKNTSFNPGQAISPMNKVSSLDWNNSVSHIFGTAGDSGYASIWDLKVKREVLQLTYNNLTLSSINWHPSQSTKLITATDNDSEPLIMTWDLRNSSVPEKIMKGHKKGILSLDWCLNDPNLLLSSGRDDSTYLWNPIKGDLLATYPTSPSWVNQVKFAPKIPEIFAASSLSKKVSIQTIQDTSEPAFNAVQTENESDFWNQISTTETQKPSIIIKQAPMWLGRPISANFGYGGKLSIAHGKNVKVVNISSKNDSLNKSAKQMITAISTNDFATIIESKKGATDSADWELLSKQISKSSVEILLNLPADANPESPSLDDDNDINDDEDFFAQITKKKNIESSYLPSGEFSLVSENEAFEKKAIEYLISNKIEDLIDLCIETDHINEALIISMNKSEELQNKAKNAYFKRNASKNSFARLLYSSSNNSISDIVKNADISSWIMIAKSIINFSKTKASFNVEMKLLGDRLLKSELENARSHALSCYIAAGSLEKVSAIWLSELETYEKDYLKQSNDDGSQNTEFEARFKALADVIEKIVIFQSSTTSSLDSTDPSELSKLGKIFVEYADCLVNFGHYELAYKLLNMMSDSIEEVKIEKNRISKAFLSTAGLNTTAIPTAKQSSKYSFPNSGAQLPAQSQQPQQAFSPIGAPVDVAKQRGEKKRNPYVFPQTAPIVAPTAITQPPVANSYGMPPPSNNPYAASAPGPAATTFQQINGIASVNKKAANPYAPMTALDSLTSASTNTGSGSMPPNPYSIASIPTASNGSQPPMMKENVVPPSVRKDIGGWNDLPQHLAPVIKPTPIPTPKQYQKHTASRSVSQPPAMPLPPAHNSGTGIPTLPVGAKKQNTPKNPYAPKPETFQTPTVPTAHSSIGRITSNVGFSPAGPIAPPTKQKPHVQSLPPPANPHTQHKNPYAPNTQPVQNNQQFLPPSGMQPEFQQFNSSPPPPPLTTQPIPPPPPAIMKKTVPPPPMVTQEVPPPPPQEVPPVAFSAESVAEQANNAAPEEYASIVSILKDQLEAVKPKVPEKFKKHIIDAEKRINMLFNHLSAGDLLTPETVSKLTTLCEALKNNNVDTAKAVRDDITTNHSDECGTWMVGVSRLLGIVEATSK